MAELRSVGRGRREMGEDVDPAVGLINLADIMLVFATGLMMALVTFWNVDIGIQFDEVLESEQVTEVSNLEEAKELLESGGSAYTEVGSVYKDPETGTLYMLTEQYESAGGSETDAGASQSSLEETSTGGESPDSSDGGNEEAAGP